MANLLHFATGTARVPILGFKYLECNRNEVRKFTIRKTTYSAISPYVKSSTCFNRIELQDYPSREILKKEVDRVSLQEIDCFGIND